MPCFAATHHDRFMLLEYINKNANPTSVVLGCGHSDSRTMIEALTIKDDVWCNTCDKRPHSGAMIVSLDESSADILCDLNHPDLWHFITTEFVSLIEGETWNQRCYIPETFDSIARVLKVGGALFK